MSVRRSMSVRQSVLAALTVVAIAVGVVVWSARRIDAPTATDEAARDRVASTGPAPLAASPVTDRRKPPAATAEAASASTSAARGKVVLHGTVRGPDGEVIIGATVYAVPKDGAARKEARRRSEGPRAEVDATGHWTFAADSFAGTWIGAVHPGNRPGFADGDAVDPSRDVDIQLGVGGIVTVRVVSDGGRPFPQARVSLWSEGEDSPAPDEPFAMSCLGMTDENGVVALQSGSSGSVRVEATAEGKFAEPAFVRLTRAEEHVDFRMHPTCVVDLTVVDAGTGVPVTEALSISIEKEPGGEQVAQYGGSSPYGTFDGEGLVVLEPGSYRVSLTAPGRAPWRSDPFMLARAGEHTSLTARLEGDRSVGDLVLELFPAEEKGVVVPIDGRALLALLRRREAAEASWQMAPVNPRWDSQAREAVLAHCDPGSYDVLVWDAVTRLTGVMSPALVRQGERSRYSMTLTKGVEAKLLDLVAADERPKVFLRGPKIDNLPLIRFFGEPGTLGASSFTPSGASLGNGSVLGPYPFDAITLSLVDVDGKKREVTLPRR